MANCPPPRGPLRRRRGAADSAYREAPSGARATPSRVATTRRSACWDAGRARDRGARSRTARTADENAPCATTRASASAVGGALDALWTLWARRRAPALVRAVRDPKRRADARRAYASAIIEAFTTAYAALLDPSNGYGDAPKRAMRHGPNALSTLLGGV